MRNFGINVLGLAQTVIGKQEYGMELWAGRVRDDQGTFVNSYSDSVTRHASVQPIDAKTLVKMGLSGNSFYINIFDLDLVSILDREKNPPRISFNGYYWMPESPSMDWNTQGGWNQVTAVRGNKVP